MNIIISTLGLFILGSLCWTTPIHGKHMVPDSRSIQTSKQEFSAFGLYTHLSGTIVFPPNFDDIDLPSIDCKSPYPTPEYIDSTFGSGGIPLGDCDSLQLEYLDNVEVLCQASYVIQRTWTFHDKCTGQAGSHTQIIKVLDKTPPVITPPNENDIKFGPTKKIGFQDCTISILMPSVQYSDDCTLTNKITIYVWTTLPDGSIITVSKLNPEGQYVFDLPVGYTYKFTYTGIDNCGNKTEVTIDNLEVEDNVPPVILCPGMTEVKATDSITYVNAASFDIGSMDDCSQVNITGRRGTLENGIFVEHPCSKTDDFNFKAQILFYCCDINHPVPLFIELQYMDAYGNASYCIIPITVIDLIKPVIWCPKDIVVQCGSPYEPPLDYKRDTVVICTQPNLQINNAFPKIYTTFIDPVGIPVGSVITDLDLQMIIDHELVNDLEITLFSPLNKKSMVIPRKGCSGQPVQYPWNINVTLNDQAYNINVYNSTGQFISAPFTCTSAKPSIGAYNQGHMQTNGAALKVFNEELVNAFPTQNLNFRVSELDINWQTNVLSNAEIQIFIQNAGLETGDEILIEYTHASGSPIGGLKENMIYLFQVINFNTLKLLTITGADITFTSAGTFHDFRATNSWMLMVEDVAPLGGGIIKEVCLHITYTPNTGLTPHVTDNTEECGISFSHEDLQVPTSCPTNTFIERQWTVTDNSGNSKSCIQKVSFQDSSIFIVQFPCDVTIDCSDNQDLSITGNVRHTGDCEHVNITYTDFLIVQSGVYEKLMRTWVVKDDCRYIPNGIPDLTTTAFDIPNNTIYFSTNLSTLLTTLNYVPGERFVIQYSSAGSTPISGLEIGQPYNVRWIDSTAVRFDHNAITGQPVTLLDQGTGPHLFNYANSARGIPVTCDELNKLAPTLHWDFSCCDAENLFANDGDGYFSFTQQITLLPTAAPQWADCMQEEFCSYDPNCLSQLIALSGQPLDPCFNATQWTYAWQIDFDQDGTLDATGLGDQAGGTYPIGEHQIIITATNELGFVNTCSKSFTIRDCALPAPVCHPVISVVFPPASAGTATVSAQNLEAGMSSDNCTDYNDLTLRLQRVSGLIPGQNQPSPSATNTLDFNCLDLPPFAPSAEVAVAVWVGDSSGNWDYCVTIVKLLDTFDVCGSSPAISNLFAHVVNINGDGVELADVEMTGSVPVAGLITDAEGKAYLGQAPFIGEYTVKPSKNINPLNGVTTFDLLLIQQHILGIKQITKPYYLIAADVNKSCQVTIADMLALRKMILKPGSEFVNNKSWRFADYNYVFPNPQKPCLFPESIYRSPLDMQVTEFKFRGIKIGDVNGDASPNSLINGDTRDRSEILYFSLNNASFEAGDELEVAVRANEFQQILGYQYALHFDPGILSFVGVEPEWALLSEENYGLHHAGSGLITTSWHHPTAQSLENGQVLYILRFRALQAGHIQQSLRLNSQTLHAEAYVENDALKDVQLQYVDNGTFENKFILFQNTPNPYESQTEIRFYLPENSNTTFKLFNATGICLKTIQGYYSRGSHALSVMRSDLPGSGLYYYQLQTETHSATKSMMLMD